MLYTVKYYIGNLKYSQTLRTIMNTELKPGSVRFPDINYKKSHNNCKPNTDPQLEINPCRYYKSVHRNIKQSANHKWTLCLLLIV